MKAIAVQGSICSGHDGFAPRPSVSGQSLFMVNGKPAMATGDAFDLHDKPNNPPHAGSVIGSTNLTINGKQVAVVGDPVSCGSTVANGDSTFNIG